VDERSLASERSSPDATALDALDEATRAIAGVLDVEHVLQLIVDRVRGLVGARYAALGIAGRDGRLIERFITAGISADERAAIGSLPRGRGLLGLIIREARTFRIADIASHPESSGFPANHPLMTSFLGVPVTAQGRPVGNLYLTDKQDATEFTAADQRLVEMFALHAGIAIDNARLHAQAAQLAVIEERDRIGRDIHDGIIQSLYAVSLSLEDVPALITESRPEAEKRVDGAIDALHGAIRELRSFIYGLRPETLDGSDVPAGIVALAEQFRHNAMIDVDVDMDPGALPPLGLDDGRQVLQLVREALSNTARHAKARRALVRLWRAGGEARLEIMDDGVGFEPAGVDPSHHHGLRNIRTRSEAIGGRVQIESTPGGGTRIILALPATTSEPR
jgi:signal transduction histidine kinase